MHLQHRAPNAQERRPAVFGVVEHLLEILQFAHQEGRSQFGLDPGGQFVLQDVHESHSHALGIFQNDIARKTVADHDVRRRSRQVPGLHVADKVQIALGKQFVGRLGDGVALAGFRTDVDEPHRRGFGAHDIVHVHTAHHREFHQVGGFALGIGAGVHQEHGLRSFHRRH